MSKLDILKKRLNDLQKKYPLLAFPTAVVLKFGDDKAGYQAALITYYAFLSLFPLLLVFFSLVSLAAANDPDLQRRFTDAALDYFPVVGDDLQRNITTPTAHGLGLMAGLLFALYGARGIANVLQDVSNNVWRISQAKRPGFPLNLLRSLGIILVGGIGLLATTVAMGYVTSFMDWGLVGKVLIAVGTLILNILVLWAVARLATAPAVATKDLLLGAICAAFFWLILQAVGTTLLLSQLKGVSASYGTFAVVLGLLFWLYLQAQLYVYALEINTVKLRKLWPRDL